MKHVPISSIIITDHSCQTRAKLDMEVVEEYAALLGTGVEFPPVELFEDGDKFWIGDGWHRVFAYHKNGDATIPANVSHGGRKGAVRCALGANIAHGLKRTNADKRRCVEIALREFPEMSDNSIADLCGVSQPFVGQIRPKQLITVISCEPAKRIGADGKVRKMPEPKREEAVTPIPTPPPTPPAPAPAPTPQAQEPAKIAPVVQFQVPQSIPKAQLKGPSNGIRYADLAIMQLEKIEPNDTLKAAAFEMVQRFINKHSGL